MPTISVFQSVTLDGVMQGLGRPDEDTRGGFVHGGWGDGYQDEVSMGFAAEGMGGGGALLFGRRTYEDLLGFWSAAPFENPFSDVLLQTTEVRGVAALLDRPGLSEQRAAGGRRRVDRRRARRRR